MESPVATLTLIRHGLSDFNQDGRFQGSGNQARLSETGIHQAHLVGQALCGHSFDAIYSSPLFRTRQTAEIVAKVAGHRHPIKYDERLREVNIPEWQGLELTEIQDKQASLFQSFFESPEEFEIRSSEGIRRPLAELYHRAAAFLHDRVLGTNSKILAISHLGTNQALINIALGLSESHHHRIQQSQCGISQLEFNATGSARLKILNDTASIGQRLPKIKSQKRGVRVVFLGLADTVDLQEYDFNLLDGQEHAIWMDSGLDTEKLGSVALAQPQKFKMIRGVPDKPLVERIKRLRADREQISTVLIAIRSGFLAEVAVHLFRIPPALMAGMQKTPVFAMVVHDSSELAAPVVQMLK